jgi:hypothetical protein
MTDTALQENPHAGQGAVLLDIGGDIGALTVTMPAAMEGVEVEIRPMSRAHLGSGQPVDRTALGHQLAHRHEHGHDHGHGTDGRSHVAVVNRPVRDTYVASLVFPELAEGRYELFEKGGRDVRMTVEVRGGQVTSAAWPP